MIKFLVDSKYLANNLQKIRGREDISKITINKNSIVLNVDNKEIEIQVCVISPLKAFPFTDGKDRHWNDVFDIVANAPRQPIVVELFDNGTRIIFEL